jgi:hypothetical protein
MKVKNFIKGAYYSIKYVAYECDNALCMCIPAYNKKEYVDICYETAKSLKQKAKENFRLAFRKKSRKDLTDRLF